LRGASIESESGVYAMRAPENKVYVASKIFGKLNLCTQTPAEFLECVNQLPDQAHLLGDGIGILDDSALTRFSFVQKNDQPDPAKFLKLLTSKQYDEQSLKKFSLNYGSSH
jgi:hypothetical protein